MIIHFDKARIIGKRSPMIYGHFLEHFHRQVYGGIFDPGNSLSDEDGFRADVIEAMKRIHHEEKGSFRRGMEVSLEPHSVSIITIGE